MTLVVTSSLMPGGGTAAANTTNFREFVQTCTSVFSSSGWINTNASGSINPSTVSASSAAGTIQGYQVWAFNDTLHNSGYPVYVKVEYGTPGSDLSSAGFWISVGKIHDNSGSINPTGTNGVGSTPRGLGINTIGNVSVRRTIRASCISGSDMVFLMGEENSSSAPVICVERTKDINGNSTNEGIIVSYITQIAGGNFAYRSSYLAYSYPSSYQPVEETHLNCIVSNKYAVFNNNLTIGMLVPILSSSFGYPSRMLGVVHQSGLASQTVHLLNLFNTQSVYWVSNATSAAQQQIYNKGQGSGDTNNFRWIMRYE